MRGLGVRGVLFNLACMYLLGSAAATAQAPFPIDGGDEFGLIWRERQDTYTSVGQQGRSAIQGTSHAGNSMGGEVALDPETDAGETTLDFRPGQTESAVVVPSVAGIVGQTIFSPAMAKAYVDSLNGELTAAGATIAAIEPMLAQHANISTSLGFSMANAQLQADATLDQQLSNNRQNGEQLRSQYIGCLADKMNEIDNYVRAVELCRGGKPRPADPEKFGDFGTVNDRMGPASSPDHPTRWSGSRSPDEIRLSDLIFVQHIGRAENGDLAQNARHLRRGFQGMFGDISYDYSGSNIYRNNNPNVKSARKIYIEPSIALPRPTLTRWNGKPLEEDDYKVKSGGSGTKNLTGLALYDRYAAEYTYDTVVGLMRAHCIFSTRATTNRDKVSFDRSKDLFFELIASNEGKNDVTLKPWLPINGENPMGILSVGDFAFSGELGLWLSGFYKSELKIGASDPDRCKEIDPYTPASNRYMAVKRALLSKKKAANVPVFLRRYLEFAETIARMRTVLIMEDTWGDSLKTLADTPYLSDASKLINLAAGSLDVDRINTDKIELQKSLTEMNDTAGREYQNGVGKTSGVTAGAKSKGGQGQGGGNNFAN